MSQSLIIFLKCFLLFVSIVNTIKGFKILLNAKNNKKGHLELHIKGSINIVCFMFLMAGAFLTLLLPLTFLL